MISVIGDGAITGGMAYEAMNHAGFLDKNMIIVLNDNQQVSLPTQYNNREQDPVGGLANTLARLQANKPLRELREVAKGITKQMPAPIQVRLGLLSGLGFGGQGHPQADAGTHPGAAEARVSLGLGGQGHPPAVANHQQGACSSATHALHQISPSSGSQKVGSQPKFSQLSMPPYLCPCPPAVFPPIPALLLPTRCAGGHQQDRRVRSRHDQRQRLHAV